MKVKALDLAPEPLVYVDLEVHNPHTDCIQTTHWTRDQAKKFLHGYMYSQNGQCVWISAPKTEIEEIMSKRDPFQHLADTFNGRKPK